MDKQKVLSRLVLDLQAFLHVLDGENLSYIAQAQKKSISELLSTLQEHKDAPVEDAEYMIMNCPSGVPTNHLRENPTVGLDSAKDPRFTISAEWRGTTSAGPVVPPHPPYRTDEDDDCYEEAEPFIPASQSTDKLDSDSSYYESYGEEEEEEDFVKDRAHYIQCTSSQPSLRPAPESRLCGYLWRKKWLGQWTRQLFIIKHNCLLCYKCAKDLHPLLELKLVGCQIVYKAKHGKKMQFELKVVTESETLTLGFHSCNQAEEWKKAIEEVSGSSYYEPESYSSLSILKSDRSSSVFYLDSEGERLSAPSSALSSTDTNKNKERAGYLNVLMNYQWQTLWCRVDRGALNLFSDEGCEESPQYTVQLTGSVIRPSSSHSHRITIVQHGNTVAVLEACSVDDKEHWVQLLQDGSTTAVDTSEQHNSHESLSGLKSRTLPAANTYMDDPFQQLCGSVQSSPIYSNTASLEHMKSHTGGNRGSVPSSGSNTYSNCQIFSSSGMKVSEVERGVQKLQLAGKRIQMRAGSEVNLVSAGSKPVKRSSFRQSLLPFCSERTQGGFLSPLLRRTASAKISLKRTPSSLLIEHGRVFHRRKDWETKNST